MHQLPDLRGEMVILVAQVVCYFRQSHDHDYDVTFAHFNAHMLTVFALVAMSADHS
jgi:hypothetical protein